MQLMKNLSDTIHTVQKKKFLCFCTVLFAFTSCVMLLSMNVSPGLKVKIKKGVITSVQASGMAIGCGSTVKYPIDFGIFFSYVSEKMQGIAFLF